MTISGILVAIGLVASAVWGGIKLVSEKAIDLTRDLFNFLMDMFKNFLSVAPKPVKLLLFFFFIITIANVVVGFFVQIQYACLDDELREYDGLIGGFQGFWERSGESLDNSTTDYIEFLETSTFPTERFGSGEDYTDVLNVRCFGNNPRLAFFKIDFLNIKYWLMLILIGILIYIGNDLRR